MCDVCVGCVYGDVMLVVCSVGLLLMLFLVIVMMWLWVCSDWVMCSLFFGVIWVMIMLLWLISLFSVVLFGGRL